MLFENKAKSLFFNASKEILWGVKELGGISKNGTLYSYRRTQTPS